jgi:hypothetical protein
VPAAVLRPYTLPDTGIMPQLRLVFCRNDASIAGDTVAAIRRNHPRRIDAEATRYCFVMLIGSNFTFRKWFTLTP